MSAAQPRSAPRAETEDVDRQLVRETQAGLPLVARPYRDIAARLGLDERDVIARMRSLLERGAVRRIAAVPNHYALGYRANGMSVWDIDDRHIHECGTQVGALEFVSHCYRRPRRPPCWPYNLFAMVHGRDRAEVERKVDQIAALVGGRARAHEILYSTRILKKTGLRLT